MIVSRRLAAVLLVALALVLVVAAGTWWVRSRHKDYCDLVDERTAQVQAGQEVSSSLITALPELHRLADAAPSDLKDEWQVVINATDGLDQALAAAQVDPATADLKSLPDTVTKDQRARITTAASRLLAPEVTAAVKGIEQQALDVCHTPLEL